MAKTAKRLSGPGLLSAAAVTKYTVPALTKTIIRHIHVSNVTGVAATLTMSIGADAAATQIFTGKVIAANDAYDHFCYHVADVGEIIQALSGTASALNLVINGDEITLG